MLTPSSAEPLFAVENTVRAQFATRPTLESVIQQLLTAAINEKYPSLNIDLLRTRLATPKPGGGWTLASLTGQVLDYLANGAALDFTPIDNQSYYLSDETGNWLGAPYDKPDMKVIEGLIKELPFSVPIGLQQALTDYWDDASDTGVSRWCWFSDVLRDSLSIRSVRQDDLSDLARETINQVIQCPERGERARQYGDDNAEVSCLESTFISSGSTSTLMSSAFLLVRGKLVLLCPPSGKVQVLPSLDAILELTERRVGQRYSVDEVRINGYQLDDNIFDTQATLILNQQLQDLGAMQLPASIGLEALRAVYQELTDPAQYVRSAPGANPQALGSLKRHLPEWLLQASPADQALYRQYSLDLARVKKASRGRNFLTGMMDIRQFAGISLLQHMKGDQKRFEQEASLQIPDATYNADDIELTFLKVVGSGGTIGNPGPVGIVERVTMSLTDLALKNLVGQPGSSFTLRHRLGLSLPAWLTPEYIKGLIRQVDVGKAYPEYLQERLLSDTDARLREQLLAAQRDTELPFVMQQRVQLPLWMQEISLQFPERLLIDAIVDAGQREQFFAAQLRAQLPLQALEFSLKQENGLTPLGARYVAALMTREQVDATSVVIRHLALLREPEASPDVVSNMFVIEPADINIGPHVLYRPFYSPSLHEFSTREALLNAIATPGELQDSVLIWLSDSARPVYGNGGFQEPHVLRYLGMESFSFETPSPASLSTNGVSDELLQFFQNGKLLQFLYGSNARALVSQADRESVSNSENRWKTLLEGGGLIFNTVLTLPFLQGPVMLTAWLASLIAAVNNDIPALYSQDPVDRELAIVDLLLNFGMLLFHAGLSIEGSRPELAEGLRGQIVRPRVPVRVLDQWHEPLAPKVVKGPVALPGELPKAGSVVLDFSFSSARNRLAPSQRTALSRFQVPLPELQPQPIQYTSETGQTLRGMYVIESKLHVLVDGNLYQVRVEPQGLVIVDPLDTQRLGPCLKSDAAGNWSLDLRLSLKGGMPSKRIADLRKQNAERKAYIEKETERLVMLQSTQEVKINSQYELMQKADQSPLYSAEHRSQIRHRFDARLQEQRETYEKLLALNTERDALLIPTPPRTVALLLEQLVRNVRRSVVLAELDRKAHYAKWEQFRPGNPDLVDAITSDWGGYLVFTKDVIDINERSIRWLELKDQYLQELYSLGEPGVENYTRLTSGRPDSEIDAMPVKLMQVNILKLASIRIWERTLLDGLEAVLISLQEQISTHAELNILEFSLSERREVLESLVERYDRALDALQGIRILNVEELSLDYFDKLIALVKGLHQYATQQLTIEIAPAAKQPKRAPKRTPTPAGKPPKRVIRTRTQGRLIGQLKPAIREGQDDIVEIHGEENNELLSAYSLRGDEWEKIDVQPARPPVLAVRQLGLVRGKASELFGQLEDHMKRADSYKKKSRFPQELEEVLTHEAARLSRLATELDQALQALPEASRLEADQTLVRDMRDGARRLVSRGQALRIQLSFELPPTHGNLQYLLDQGLVQIAPSGDRVPLRGERQDFMQEYMISKKDGSALWYAHFHYAALNTPKQSYAVAHLKTMAQRRQNYYSQLRDAKSSQGVVDVHRGQIGKLLAQQWFLPLVP